MDARRIERIEKGADVAAAAVFAAAAAYAALRFGPVPAAVTGIVAFIALFRLLGSIEPEAPSFAIDFEAPDFPPVAELAELLLTDVYVQPLAEPAKGDELVLEDVLTELCDDSRVVRLFDPAAMPTPAELRSRIDRHREAAAGAQGDGSQALHDALAELRRSLR
jgi:hypothetical protein